MLIPKSLFEILFPFTIVLKNTFIYNLLELD